MPQINQVVAILAFCVAVAIATLTFLHPNGPEHDQGMYESYRHPAPEFYSSHQVMSPPLHFTFHAVKTCPADSVPNADGSICCKASCGKCGGYGCDLRPGGAPGCCMGTIIASGKICGSSPCLADKSTLCPGDSIEFNNGEIAACCPATCGECGGYGCDLRPGGGPNCCVGTINAAGTVCGSAPCVPKPTCPPNSIPGGPDVSVCCPLSCGLCGGYGCDLRPGGGSNCCAGIIAQSGKKCGSAPCIASL